MKKIFSLVCATLVAFGASAQFQNQEPNIEKAFDANQSIEAPVFDLTMIDENMDMTELDIPGFVFTATSANRTNTSVARKVAQGGEFRPDVKIGNAFSYKTAKGYNQWRIVCFGMDTTYCGEIWIAEGSTGINIVGEYTTNDSVYVRFVRAAGDTLISTVDGEAFSIVYKEKSEKGTDIYTVEGKLTATNAKEEVETIEMNFDIEITAALDYYYYSAYNYYYRGFQTYFAAYQQTGNTVYYQYAYMFYQYAQQYKSQMYVWLQDSPVVPTADTVVCKQMLIPNVSYNAARNRNAITDRFYTDSATVFLAIYFEGDSLAEGVYEIGNGLIEDLCYVYDYKDSVQYYINREEPSRLEVSRSENGDTTYFALDMAARDGKVYNLTAKYWMPKHEKASAEIPLIASFNNTTGQFTSGVTVNPSFFASQHIIAINGYALTKAETQYLPAFYASLYFTVGDSTMLGTYTTDSLINSTQYTGAIKWMTISGQRLNISMRIMAAEFEITDLDGDGYGDHLEGLFTCNDNGIYKIYFNFVNPLVPTPTNQVEETKANVVKTLRNGQITIEKNGVKYNIMGAKL